MRQLRLERLGVLVAREVAALTAPRRRSCPATRSIICLTECSRAGRTKLAAEVLLGDDVGGVLGPGSSGTRRRAARTKPCRRGRSERPARSHSTASNGCSPGVVKKRLTERPSPVRTSGSSWVWGIWSMPYCSSRFPQFPLLSLGFCSAERAANDGGCPGRKTWSAGSIAGASILVVGCCDPGCPRRVLLRSSGNPARSSVIRPAGMSAVDAIG